MAGAATVEKALDVLFHLHEAGDALGLTEIGRALDLPKSSCHRLLSSLVARDVVEQDFAGRYRPGLALLALGIGAQNREPVIRAARSTLESEARHLGETVFLVGARRGTLRVLDKSEGSGFLRAAPAVGDEIPVDVTAAGQLFRAFGRGPEWESAGEADEAAEADERRAAVRARGYALNQDAWISGLSVLGVPIWQAGPGGGQDLVAVMALAASSPRFDALGEGAVAERLLAAAEIVGQRLGLAESPRSRGSSRGSAAPAAQIEQGGAS
ncbi:MAG: IclR family transcriptional regulator [Myxococcota bacterium]